MRILVLGGTKFLGRAIVEAALARGHALTLFTRGETNPELFAGEVVRLQGDRDGDTAALAEGSWDAVVDTSGYVPRVVRQSTDALRDHVDHYTFISTVSVYASFAQGPDEESPTAKLDDPASEDVDRDYGALKAACEDVVETLPFPTLIIRPGLIVGPHDPTNRFTYWVTRIARGAEVLAPGNPEAPVQFVDVRDLAGWTVRSIEESRMGVLNATGPERPLTMREALEDIRAATTSDAKLTWVSDEFLRERDIGTHELPLWLPDPQWHGLHEVDVSRAVAAGLRFRSVEETARDTLAWSANSAPEAPETYRTRPSAGMSDERERELLAAWHG